MQYEDIRKVIHNESWIYDFLVFFSLFVPGFCYFYFIKHELFINIDFVKLFILSVIYTGPSFLLLNAGARLASSEIIKNRFKERDTLEIEIRSQIENFKKENLFFLIPKHKRLLRRLLNIPNYNLFIHQLTAMMIYVSLLGTLSLYKYAGITKTLYGLDWFTFSYNINVVGLFVWLCLLYIIYQVYKRMKNKYRKQVIK